MKTRSSITRSIMNQGGDSIPPSREVLNQSPTFDKIDNTDNTHAIVLENIVNAAEDLAPAKNVHECQIEPPLVECEDLSGGSEQPPSRAVQAHLTGHQESIPVDTPCLVLPVANAVDTLSEDMVFTHHTDPFQPACIAKIIDLVQIGKDITTAQCKEVRQLILEFADCFALSLSEVNLIPGAIHKLNIPEDTTFHMKILQRSFNPDQRAFMEAKVDEMLEAGIICPIYPEDIKCIAPSVLAQKVHENTGLSLDELKHKVNDECIKHDLPIAFDLPPCPAPAENTTAFTLPKKWCLCQDFGEINKVMPIAPVPQGDVCAKPLRLSGHWYVHIF